MEFTREHVLDCVKQGMILMHDLFKDHPQNGEALYDEKCASLANLLISEFRSPNIAQEIIPNYPDHVTAIPTQPWTDAVAKKFCEDLTKTQKVVLKTILSNGNKASPLDLKTAIAAAGIPWRNNLTLGGAIGGMSRKCVYRYGIPYVYVWDKVLCTYSISTDALPFISKYL